MDEEVQIMGDSQDKVLEEVYKSLAAEWVKVVDRHDLFELLEVDKKDLREAIMDAAEKKGLSERDEDNLIVAIEGLQSQIRGENIGDLLPENVSRRDSDSPKIKAAGQRIALEAVTQVQPKKPEGRGR